MFEKLQQRWNVNALNLFLVICTFAIGGSLCGYFGRKILIYIGLDKGVLWILSYLLLITLLWPLSVLLVSIPLGQFRFFRKYIGKIMGKLSSKSAAKPPIRLAIFASGAGSNAANLIRYFKFVPEVKIDLIICNNPQAGVLQLAQQADIPTVMVSKKSLEDDSGCLQTLRDYHIDYLILAGFLWKIPVGLIQAYPNRIINLHPALLPKFGGKGMYGRFVHEAVVAQGEKESGITIHLADELYDHGKVLFQATCTVEPSETPDSLANKIHALEQTHFPKVVHEYLKKQNPR